MKEPKRSETRDSAVVRAGRVYQSLSEYTAFIDYFFRVLFYCRKSKTEKPFIAIVSPPRSGSTLTYQLLTTGIQNFHLTNLWNLLYATPVFGGMLSNVIVKRHVSSFSSHHGFVPGLNGEAEGLRFWSHWSGQALDENPAGIKFNKLEKLKEIFQYIGSDDDPFIAGYLGHAFCIEALRTVFKKIIFVYLTRDLLSNAYSIYRFSDKAWPSIRPAEHVNYTGLSRHESAAIQLVLIHKKIIRQISNDDTLCFDYSDICNNPRGTVARVIEFAAKKNITLIAKNLEKIPERFTEKKIRHDLDEDSIKVSSVMKNEFEKLESREKQFLGKLV